MFVVRCTEQLNLNESDNSQVVTHCFTRSKFQLDKLKNIEKINFPRQLQVI